MQSVLIVIHILIVVALIAVVLLQRSEGGALGAGGGTGSFMTGRGQANALSRATAILGAMFFATALLMSILSSWSRAPHSILDKGGAPAPAGQTAPQTLASVITIPGGSDVYRLSAQQAPQKLWTGAQDLVYALALDANGHLRASLEHELEEI